MIEVFDEADLRAFVQQYNYQLGICIQTEEEPRYVVIDLQNDPQKQIDEALEITGGEVYNYVYVSAPGIDEYEIDKYSLEELLEMCKLKGVEDYI